FHFHVLIHANPGSWQQTPVTASRRLHGPAAYCTSAKSRDDLFRVIGDQPLFVTVIKIDVELRDPRFFQLLEFGDVPFGITENAKALDDIRRNEIEIRVVTLA